MKQLPITTAEIWAIPVPAGATDFYSKIVWSEIALFFRYREQTEYGIVGDFDFEILGTATADEIDFDAGPLFENAGGMLNNKYALHAAIKAAGYYFVNPFKDIRGLVALSVEEQIEHHDVFNRWQAAQQSVVEKLVIIKKV